MEIRPANPEAATAEAAPETETETAPAIFEGLPKEVQSIPAVQWVSIGRPPGIRFRPQEYFPELRPLIKHAPELVKNGLGLYGAQSGDTVLYNPIFIKPEELAAADEQGNLDQIIPDYATLSGQTPQPVDDKLKAELVGEEDQSRQQLQDLVQAPQPAPPTPVPAPPAQPAATAGRIKNMAPGGPSSGPVPGQGRVLNALLKPAA